MMQYCTVPSEARCFPQIIGVLAIADAIPLRADAF